MECMQKMYKFRLAINKTQLGWHESPMYDRCKPSVFFINASQTAQFLSPRRCWLPLRITMAVALRGDLWHHECVHE
jgi:hypothetical protein